MDPAEPESIPSVAEDFGTAVLFIARSVLVNFAVLAVGAGVGFLVGDRTGLYVGAALALMLKWLLFGIL